MDSSRLSKLDQNQLQTRINALLTGIQELKNSQLVGKNSYDLDYNTSASEFDFEVDSTVAVQTYTLTFTPDDQVSAGQFLWYIFGLSWAESLSGLPETGNPDILVYVSPRPSDKLEQVYDLVLYNQSQFTGDHHTYHLKIKFWGYGAPGSFNVS